MSDGGKGSKRRPGVITDERWDAIWGKHKESSMSKKIASVQVVPFIEMAGGSVFAQPEGPNAETSGWAVYKRDSDGIAHWFADTGNEEDAMFVGRLAAMQHSVGIELQAWKKAGVLVASEPLSRCAAARDGDCVHIECPQLRDNEPHNSGRHCPLDLSPGDPR